MFLVLGDSTSPTLSLLSVRLTPTIISKARDAASEEHVPHDVVLCLLGVFA